MKLENIKELRLQGDSGISVWDLSGKIMPPGFFLPGTFPVVAVGIIANLFPFGLYIFRNFSLDQQVLLGRDA